MNESSDKKQNNVENDKLMTRSNETSSFASFFVYIIFALVIVVPFRIFIAQPYIVSGSSMYPTFENGDYLIVDQISKRFELPKRGSVVIILNPKYPKESTKYFIKRLIGFPNEEINIVQGKVSIKGNSHEEFTLEEDFVVYPKIENYNIKLDSNEYFVMGDNRAGSSDSRSWGPIKKDAIIGIPIIRLLPIKNIEILPGKFE